MNETIINYEAEFCGKVPLNQTNLIQPHGILLIVDKKNFTIVQASENVEALLQKPAQEIVQTSLLDYLPKDQADLLKEKFKDDLPGKIPLLFTFGKEEHLTLVKLHGPYFILEVERSKITADKQNSFVSIYQDLKYVMEAIDACANTNEMFDIAIRELKRISGFDKIMVYKFDEEWNGDVMAEVKEEGMESYMGLKFPASDIPKQARELYRKTPFRLIPDVNYQPVRIFPLLNPLTNTFIDLSDSNLRSVAGVHLEYLKNMGVVASMSTRILKNNQLWGLISCHHRTPKFLSYEMCSLFELVSNVISVKIVSVQNEDSFRYKSDMQQLHTDFIEEVYRLGSLKDAFFRNGKHLMTLLSATGVSMISNGEVSSIGTTPSEHEVMDLVFWLQSKNIGKLFQNAHLSGSYESAQDYASISSGILALPVQPEKGNFIIAFRPEVVRQVNWGGNPNEAVNFEPDRTKYHPRNSFKLWQQTLSKTALPWKPDELEVADHLRNFILDFTLNKIYS